MRLIDADLLKETRFPESFRDDETLLVPLSDVIKAIDMAPTVVLGVDLAADSSLALNKN
jgi:hypothetical protein